MADITLSPELLFEPSEPIRPGIKSAPVVSMKSLVPPTMGFPALVFAGLTEYEKLAVACKL